jgi:hypothetical protein
VHTMKDSALSVLAREGEGKTLEVVATMKRVKAAGLITDPPHQLGFLRGFFDKALAVLLAQNNGHLEIPVRKSGVTDEALPDLGSPISDQLTQPSAPVTG